MNELEETARKVFMGKGGGSSGKALELETERPGFKLC